MQVIIEYRLKPDAVDEERRQAAAVFAELERVRPNWLRWEHYLLDDGVTGVSLVEVEDPSRLGELEAFATYRSGIDNRCDVAPVTRIAEVTGRYPT